MRKIKVYSINNTWRFHLNIGEKPSTHLNSSKNTIQGWYYQGIFVVVCSPSHSYAKIPALMVSRSGAFGMNIGHEVKLSLMELEPL
jgi:hypothetical protein